MNLIFSADKNWGIGYKSDLLFNLPGDMAFFKKMTTGKVVIMGRVTLESLPGGKPLPNRRNIILTANRGFTVEGAEVCHSLSELFLLIEELDNDILVIGGENLYRQLMPYCKKAYITRFNATAPADRFMPDFDAAPEWKLIEESKEILEKGVAYRFCTYEQENYIKFKGACNAI